MNPFGSTVFAKAVAPCLVIGIVWLMDCKVLLSHWCLRTPLLHQFSAQMAPQ